MEISQIHEGDSSPFNASQDSEQFRMASVDGSYGIQSDASLEDQIFEDEDQGQISPPLRPLPRIQEEQGFINVRQYLDQRYRGPALVHFRHELLLAEHELLTGQHRIVWMEEQVRYIQRFGEPPGHHQSHDQLWETYDDEKRLALANYYQLGRIYDQAFDTLHFIKHTSMPGNLSSDALQVYQDSGRQHQTLIQGAFVRLSTVLTNFQVFRRAHYSLPVRLARRPHSPFSTGWTQRYSVFLRSMLNQDLKPAFANKIEVMVKAFGVGATVRRINKHMKDVKRNLTQFEVLATNDPSEENMSNRAVMADAVLVYDFEYRKLLRRYKMDLARQRFEEGHYKHASRLEKMEALLYGNEHSEKYVRRWTRRARRILTGCAVQEGLRFIQKMHRRGFSIISETILDSLLDLSTRKMHLIISGMKTHLWSRIPEWIQENRKLLNALMPMDRRIFVYLSGQMGQKF